jgi:hypothetical protein
VKPVGLLFGAGGKEAKMEKVKFQVLIDVRSKDLFGGELLWAMDSEVVVGPLENVSREEAQEIAMKMFERVAIKHLHGVIDERRKEASG